MSDMTKAEINEQIRNMLQYPHEARNAYWEKDMNFLLPKATLIFNKMFSDSGTPQRHCIGLFPTEYPESSLAKTFTECAMIAAEDHYGIMIMNELEPGNFTHHISYGGVWSYLNFDHIQGPVNLTVRFEHALKSGIENPMEAIINDSNEIVLSEPSHSFFPVAARMAISEQIKKAHPDSKVHFYLHEEKKRAMPMSLMVEITNIPENTDREIISRILNWNLPPLLRPSSIVHNRPSIYHAMFGKDFEELTSISPSDANFERETEFNKLRKQLK